MGEKKQTFEYMSDAARSSGWGSLVNAEKLLEVKITAFSSGEETDRPPHIQLHTPQYTTCTSTLHPSHPSLSVLCLLSLSVRSLCCTIGDFS